MYSYLVNLYPNASLGENSVILNKPFRNIDLGSGILLGRGLSSLDGKQFWVNIPKNASNSMSAYLQDKNWQDANYHINKEIRRTAMNHVILRDPVERWRKCITEICYIDRPGKYIKKWFQDRRKDFISVGVFYDLHLVRQADHIIDLDWRRTKFYNCDSTLAANILNEFNNEGIFPEENVTDNIKIKKSILNWVDELLTDSLKEKIQDFYRLDYELINKVIPVPSVVLTDKIIATANTTTDNSTDSTEPEL